MKLFLTNDRSIFRSIKQDVGIKGCYILCSSFFYIQTNRFIYSEKSTNKYFVR